MTIGSIVEGVVTKITAFGAFVELDTGLEALIHVTELSDQPFGKVEDIIQKGERIKAKVIKVDPEHKKIALSIKEHLIESNNENHDDIIVGSAKKAAPKKSRKKTKEAEENTVESS
jgi:small subunit ribosomal protein S1